MMETLVKHHYRIHRNIRTSLSEYGQTEYHRLESEILIHPLDCDPLMYELKQNTNKKIWA